MSIHLELRCERNPDGTYRATTWQDGNPLVSYQEGGGFEIKSGTCLDVQRIHAALRQAYPGVQIRVHGPCAECHG